MSRLPKSWHSIRTPNQWLKWEQDHVNRQDRRNNLLLSRMWSLTFHETKPRTSVDNRGQVHYKAGQTTLSPWDQLRLKWIMRNHPKPKPVPRVRETEEAVPFGSQTSDQLIVGLCELREDLVQDKRLNVLMKGANVIPSVENAIVERASQEFDAEHPSYLEVDTMFRQLGSGELLAFPLPTLLKYLSVFDFFRREHPNLERTLALAVNEHLTELDAPSAFAALKRLHRIATRRAARLGAMDDEQEIHDFFREGNFVERLQVCLPRWVQSLLRSDKKYEATWLARFVFEVGGPQLAYGAATNSVSRERVSQWFVYWFYTCGLDGNFIAKDLLQDESCSFLSTPGASQLEPPTSLVGSNRSGFASRRKVQREREQRKNLDAVDPLARQETTEIRLSCLRNLFCVALPAATSVAVHSRESFLRRERAMLWIVYLSDALRSHLSEPPRSLRSSVLSAIILTVLSTVLNCRQLFADLVEEAIGERHRPPMMMLEASARNAQPVTRALPRSTDEPQKGSDASREMERSALPLLRSLHDLLLVCVEYILGDRHVPRNSRDVRGGELEDGAGIDVPAAVAQGPWLAALKDAAFIVALARLEQSVYKEKEMDVRPPTASAACRDLLEALEVSGRQGRWSTEEAVDAE